jgi:hypothetical protein
LPPFATTSHGRIDARAGTRRANDLESHGGFVGSGSYTFAHRALHPHRNYLEALVRAPTLGQTRPTVLSAVRGAHFADVRALVGPIVGKIEARSAIVLLEARRCGAARAGFRPGRSGVPRGHSA